MLEVGSVKMPDLRSLFFCATEQLRQPALAHRPVRGSGVSVSRGLGDRRAHHGVGYPEASAISDFYFKMSAGSLGVIMHLVGKRQGLMLSLGGE